MFAAALTSATAQSTLVLQPPSGVATARHIVLVSGDEEYRSEEALPQLAKILSQRHGFTCTVLFALDPDGTINPDNGHSLPGAEALDSAAFIIMELRHRAWSDEAMKHFVDALRLQRLSHATPSRRPGPRPDPPRGRQVKHGHCSVARLRKNLAKTLSRIT